MINELKVGNILKNGWLKTAEVVLLWLSLFLMSWRMRYAITGGEVLGVYVEYSSWHLYLTDLVIIGLLLLWWWRRRDKLKFPPDIVHWPLLGFLIWMTVSVLWAEDKMMALMVAGRWWLVWGWFLYLINEVKDIMTMIWPVALGVLLQAGLGITQYLVNSSLGLQFFGEPLLNPSQGGVPVVEMNGIRQVRANGLMPHANMLGGLLAVVIPFLLYGLMTLKKGWEKNWLYIIVAISTIALVLSFSRAAWVGFVVVIGIFIWQVGIKKYWQILLASVGVFIITLLTQYRAVWNRVVVVDSLEARSLMERMDGWNYWQLVFDRVAFFGTGAGNYIQKLIDLEPAQSGWWYQPVHNIYLLITGELGLIGIGIFIWFLVGVVVIVKRKMLFDRFFSIMIAGPLSAILIIGLFDHWPFSMQQGRLLIFWALALLVMGYQMSLKSKKT